MPQEVMGAAASAGCVLDEGASHSNAGASYLVTRGLVKGYGEGAARMEVLRLRRGNRAWRDLCAARPLGFGQIDVFEPYRRP